MSLNESIVEEAALAMPKAALTRPLPRGEEREVGYAVGHLPAPRSATRQAGGPQLAPGEYAEGTLTPALSQGERESYGEVVQSRVARTLIPAFSQREKEEERKAIRRLNPAIPEKARATLANSATV